MSKPSRGQVGWGIVVVVMVLTSLFFGVRLPIPPEPAPVVVEPEQPAAAVSDQYTESLIVDKEFTSNGTSSLVGVATFGANPIFEGATADAYETTLAITDPTADRTITVPNSTGTIALNPYGASIEFEGATADAYETTLAVTDPTADRTLTLPNETAGVMVSSLVTNGTAITNSVTGASNALVFEGATGDSYDLRLTVVDPTADRTATFPNETGAVMMSSLATNGTDVANSVTGASNGLVFEGSAADGYETTLSVTNPTADQSVVFANGSGTVMLSSLATNAPDVANAVIGVSNGLLFEGATANEFETTVTPTDPTADRTLTLPDVTGTVMVSGTAAKTIFGSNTITGTLSVTHGLTTPLYAFCVLGADSVANAASCSTLISGGTVTVKVWKADGATEASTAVKVDWMVVGTP
jgi:hypothetical protein